eukprot:CAMPEP_0185570422 /NCGR_PEP_ID=MMETSP0434-20130131/2745_1 /TAXON_ID=626734 ORGANISM="Favella taraikaensis, Strain Fe Narragansett Bay" /NCGR_SAMPLE_ID=MMETSP0434 /ASSEMBLY_ACC=CAM_ASM_000379 /LENGTH=37 /DNA_ID= /DNA_START= /DNA_END= /DNA_ORIENTATION=
MTGRSLASGQAEDGAIDDEIAQAIDYLVGQDRKSETV